MRTKHSGFNYSASITAALEDTKRALAVYFGVEFVFEGGLQVEDEEEKDVGGGWRSVIIHAAITSRDPYNDEFNRLFHLRADVTLEKRAGFEYKTNEFPVANKIIRIREKWAGWSMVLRITDPNLPASELSATSFYEAISFDPKQSSHIPGLYVAQMKQPRDDREMIDPTWWHGNGTTDRRQVPNPKKTS